MPADNYTWKDTVPSIVAGGFFLAQMIYGGFFLDHPRIDLIKYFGIGIFILSAFFGMGTIFIFKKKGGVKKGESFINTTKIVDTGIYSIVRHPQYSAFNCWATAAMLLFQDIIVILFGIPVIVLTYYDMMREDKVNIKKFGIKYEEYMKKVPRANFVWGIIKLILR